VLIMTVCVLPLGVITGIYLQEYASHEAWWTRGVRMAVSNLAGVPGVVFGLFGLGFFVYFIGGAIDHAAGNSTAVWGKPALLWSSLTMASLTLPVVVVTTEEALRSVPQSLRDASMGLGANQLQTLLRVLLPQALPGILTGVVLAISRAAGEVAPIMITGAAFMAPLPKGPTDQFMELGYHVFVLATQSPNVEVTKPILFATVLLLLVLTLSLNLLAMFGRAYLRRKYHHSLQ
ncbi:MAG TPA: phosphate ABC transporter permease PstA, partial [Verrucomicrobiae bacterium]